MTVDLSGSYWVVKQPVETVLPLNGGRLFYTHYVRVIEARIRAEQMVPVLLLPVVAVKAEASA